MDRRNFLLLSTIAGLHSSGSPASELLRGSVGSPDVALRISSCAILCGRNIICCPGRLRRRSVRATPFSRRVPRLLSWELRRKGWQHAVSANLVHWRHMPIALSPTDGSYDAHGTFTGGVLPGADGANVIYTGVTKVPEIRKLFVPRESARCNALQPPRTTTSVCGRNATRRSSTSRPPV